MAFVLCPFVRFEILVTPNSDQANFQRLEAVTKRMTENLPTICINFHTGPINCPSMTVLRESKHILTLDICLFLLYFSYACPCTSCSGLRWNSAMCGYMYFTRRWLTTIIFQFLGIFHTIFIQKRDMNFFKYFCWFSLYFVYHASKIKLALQKLAAV